MATRRDDYIDRKRAAEELMRRTQESNERKEGETLSKYFDPDLDLTFVKFSTTKEEPHILDIIPFIAGSKIPKFMRVREGDLAYYLDIYVHQNVGGGKAWVVCPQKNYDKPCPICEYIDSLRADGKEYEDFSDIVAKRRCVYNIVNMSNSKEERKGVQIWEVSHRFSEKPIQAAAKNPRGGGYIAFSHPDKELGQSISFSVDSDKYKTVSGFKLVPRDYDISDDILQQALKLDQIIVTLSYKEIDNLMSRGASDDVPDRYADEEEERNDYREEKVSAPQHECPAGKTFGVSIDKIVDCDECPLYKKCSRRAEEIEKEREEEKNRPTRAGAGRRKI